MERRPPRFRYRPTDRSQLLDGQDRPSLWDRRLSALEASAKSVAGKDMIGKETFHEIYDVLGDEMGSKAHVDRAGT
jgi:hypothetical protein